MRADPLAGITGAMVAVPLSLAIPIASGAPPAQGLVTAVVAGFLISALGGSRVQIDGPTGAFIVVVASVIAAHGIEGLVTATLRAGLLPVLAGLLQAGRRMDLVPEAVVNGFTIGIAAILMERERAAHVERLRAGKAALVLLVLTLELTSPGDPTAAIAAGVSLGRVLRRLGHRA